MKTDHRPERVLVVGGVAGGASCAARLRRLNESVEIIIFERGPYVSFANCGLPYYLGKVIKKQESLLVASPEQFCNWFNIEVRTRSEVISIDRKAGTIKVRDHASGKEYEESYDKLMLAPGAKPLRPPLPGIDLDGIFSLRTIPDSEEIRQWLRETHARQAVVVGGGFIGLEMAENLKRLGLEVTLIEMLPQVMPPMDPEMVSPVHDHLKEEGVDLQLGSAVDSFEKAENGSLVVKTRKGGAFPADMVILAIGVSPESDLAREAGLELGQRGSIKVDNHMRTSDPNIYAAGDAVEVQDYVLGVPVLIPLAGPANRQGRIAADAMVGRDSTFRGVQGTAVCGVFDLTIAQTGANEKSLKQAGVAYEKIYLSPNHHVGYYPDAKPITIKLLFSPADGKVLGAQAVGEAGVERRIDVMAMAIQQGATVYDLEEAELCYAPQYGAAKDPVNMAGFIAGNHLRGDHPIVHWDRVASRDKETTCIIDVRTKNERDEERMEDSVSIPLHELRSRLGEIPKDKEIWVHCKLGQRAYYAVRILQQNGFNAKNLGGFDLSKLHHKVCG